jgi:Spy/CpxP family protein refolding chaperone
VKKLILSFLALAMILTPMLFADTTTTTPPSPPAVAELVANRVAQLTKLLDLTTAQQTQAATIFTTQETALAALKTSLDTAQTALQTAVKTNDSNGIANGATTIGNLTAQETLARATGDAAFWLILTADQQTKLGVLNDAGVGGPGGGRGNGAGQGAPPAPKPGSSGSTSGRY